MIPQKYQESTKLISLTYGLPNIIQQQIVISDNEIELARNCILLIKQKITELQSKNNNMMETKYPYGYLMHNSWKKNHLPTKVLTLDFKNEYFPFLGLYRLLNSILGNYWYWKSNFHNSRLG